MSACSAAIAAAAAAAAAAIEALTSMIGFMMVLFGKVDEFDKGLATKECCISRD